MWSGGIPAGCDTAYYTGSFTPDTDRGINDDSSRTYQGIRHYNADTSQNICKVTFYPKLGAGDISGKSYHAEVWSLAWDGAEFDLDTQQGSDSDSVSGNNSWDASIAVTFTFPATITLSSNTYYAIVITEENAADGSNYAVLRYDNNISASTCDATYGYRQVEYSDAGDRGTTDADDCYEVVLYE